MRAKCLSAFLNSQVAEVARSGALWLLFRDVPGLRQEIVHSHILAATQSEVGTTGTTSSTSMESNLSNSCAALLRQACHDHGAAALELLGNSTSANTQDKEVMTITITAQLC